MADTKGLTGRIQTVSSANRALEETAVSIRQQESTTRDKLTRRIANYYFFGLGLIIVGLPTYNYLMYSVANKPALIISLKDALITYSSVAGPTFGVVIAYYFKSHSD